MRNLNLDWRVFAGAGAGIVVLGGYFLYKHFHQPPSPEELERKRRLRINQIGRIVEGQVTELIELPAEEAQKRGFLQFAAKTKNVVNGARKMVCYSYSISGVTYETAQDVTGLEQRVHLQKLAAGQSASVKYNPSNPSDSILVADDWSGIH